MNRLFSSTRYRLLQLAVTAFAGLSVVLLSSWQPTLNRPPSDLVGDLYRQHLARFDSALVYLTSTVDQRRSIADVQTAFRQARLSYKYVEPLTEYYFLQSAKSLNGPNVPEGEKEEDGFIKRIQPTGFQVIEPWLFPGDTTHRADIHQQIKSMRATLSQLRWVAADNRLGDQFIFDALRQEVYRIETLGITGFDSPVALYSLPEAAASLAGVRQTLACYPLARKAPSLARHINQTIRQAQQALQRANSFNQFDRLTFIRQYAHPLTRLLHQARQTLGIPLVEGKRLLRPDALTLSDPTAFNPAFFTTYTDPHPTTDRVALGKRLFNDPVLSAAGLNRSCASCHQPNRGFQDGEVAAFQLDSATGRLVKGRLSRNTPTLWNAAFQSNQFMDMRVFTVEQQLQDVIHNPREMGGSLTDAVKRMQQDKRYRDQFAASYTQGLTLRTVRHALASYVRSLVSLNSRTDQYLRGDDRAGQPVALSADEKRGFNVFMGKAKCATCHYFPLYNGLLPPAYVHTESEVIGTPATAANTSLSPDPGRYGFTGIDFHRHAFKIPTLRRIGQTAPYMHNGVYTTLEQVVDFYDRGGGQGLGFSLPNQTLPADKLNLTRAEKRALVAFLKSL